MTVPYMPHKFTTGEQLDLERINDNLERGASDVGRSMALRYTYCVDVFDLDGLADTDAEAQRTRRFRRYTANAAYEIAFVELVIYAASGATWTLACSDDTWPSITLDTAGATTEARAVSNSRIVVPTGSSGVDLVLSADAASTITRGYLVVTYRSDRGSQGDTFTPYSPTLLNSQSSTAGSTLDTELQALETAVGYDAAADKDLRIETFRVRSLADGTSKTWRLPSGARRKAGYVLVCVASGSATLTCNVDGAPIDSVVGTGTSSIASDVGTLSGTLNDDPTDFNDDTTVELAASGATVTIGYVSIFWS